MTNTLFCLRLLCARRSVAKGERLLCTRQSVSYESDNLTDFFTRQHSRPPVDIERLLLGTLLAAHASLKGQLDFPRAGHQEQCVAAIAAHRRPEAALFPKRSYLSKKICQATHGRSQAFCSGLVTTLFHSPFTFLHPGTKDEDRAAPYPPFSLFLHRQRHWHRPQCPLSSLS